MIDAFKRQVLCSECTSWPAFVDDVAGSKCVIHTAFFAKRTEKTIDASITTYHRYEKALRVMPRRRDRAIGAVCRPRRPANKNYAKTEGANQKAITVTYLGN